MLEIHPLNAAEDPKASQFLFLQLYDKEELIFKPWKFFLKISN